MSNILTRTGEQASPQEIELARSIYQTMSESNIEIDDDAMVSHIDQESGFWVQAWVYCEPDSGDDLDKPTTIGFTPNELLEAIQQN